MTNRSGSEREEPIRLSDKRLLSISEFCIYTSMGRDGGMKLAEAAGAIFRIGKRVTIDRVKFDKWCDENSCLY